MGNRGVNNGRAKRRVGGSKPTGEFGVAVDRVDNRVVLTSFQGDSVFTISWRSADALTVASMLERAAFDGEQKEEVVRASGIVLPGAADVAKVTG